MQHIAFLLLMACSIALSTASAIASEDDAGLDLQIERLAHPLPEARRDAVVAIADYGAHGARAIEALVGTLDDLNVDVRRAAVVALAAVGAQSETAVLSLVRAMSDPDWVVRRQAADAFDSVDGALGLDALRAQLRAESEATRLAAAVAVDKLGTRAVSALPELLDLLTARNWKLRGAAARAIGSIGPAAGQAGVDGLATALRDRDWGVAEPSVEALSRMGPSAVPALITALSDKAVPVRWGAARALGRIGARAEAAVGPLSNALTDPVMQVRWAAARALLAMGPAAAPATPALSAALEDEEWVVRWSAARALGRSAAGDALDLSVSALAAALGDRDSRVCEAAAFALEAIGPAASAAIPALNRASRHGLDDSAERCSVIDAGPAAEEILIDNGWTVRWASVRALGVVGGGDPAIIDALSDAADDEIWQVRGVATLALGQFDGRRHPAALQTIKNRVADESSGVRRAALTALGSAGGEGARELLETALEDSDTAIRDAANDALEMLEAQGK